jgi:hypothetical protein
MLDFSGKISLFATAAHDNPIVMENMRKMHLLWNDSIFLSLIFFFYLYFLKKYLYFFLNAHTEHEATVVMLNIKRKLR